MIFVWLLGWFVGMGVELSELIAAGWRVFRRRNENLLVLWIVELHAIHLSPLEGMIRMVVALMGVVWHLSLQWRGGIGHG